MTFLKEVVMTAVILNCLLAFTAPGSLEQVKSELLAADKAFCDATTAKGIDGWMSYMAADAARLGPIGSKFVSGLEAIRRQDAALFSDPRKKLLWEPGDVHAFADGKSGITTGKYRIVEKRSDGKDKVLSTGAYVTTWRKDAAGWRVIFDTGVPDEKK
jgi:ketosteroid isomerase-like protein